jgi:hypothetical protein
MTRICTKCWGCKMKIQRVSTLREFDVQNRMRQVQVLIKSKRFDEAEDLLEEIATPDADRLLLRLRKYRLSSEINKVSSNAAQQSNTKAPNLATPKRYQQVRILSYLVRIVALVWAAMGIVTLFGWTTTSVAMVGMVAQLVERHDVVIVLLVQALFIYIFGVGLEMLADMAENLAINTALLSDENANS